jgi:hypothetical protein
MLPMEAVAIAVEPQRRPPPIRQVYPITETVSGFAGTRVVTAVSTGAVLEVVVPTGWSPNNATLGLSFGCLSTAGVADGYNAELVASILQADAAPSEASFNNVVDMLDWLNRD